MFVRHPTGLLVAGWLGLGPGTALAADLLEEAQRLPFSGARDVTLFEMEGRQYLAIPQLAEDIPDTEANMNGGNSDVDSVVFEWRHGRFEEFQRIPSHGGEDIEFLTLEGQPYLAVCGVRSGSGPYNANSYATLYGFDGSRFYPVQNIATFAAKQCRHFSIDDRDFLGIAEGITAEGVTGDANSEIYEWVDGRFEPFQTIPSKWGYNWTFFEQDGERYLVFVDHLDGWTIYRWQGAEWEAALSMVETGARAMTHFRIGDDSYFAYANLVGTSRLYRFTGDAVEEVQAFDGNGGREFHYFQVGSGHYLARINFIAGPRTAPVSSLQSQVYRWDNGAFVEVESFPTLGGTDAGTFVEGDDTYLVVSNSLNEQIRFRVDSVLYRIKAE